MGEGDAEDVRQLHHLSPPPGEIARETEYVDVVGKDATGEAGSALRDDLGWEVVRHSEEDTGVARYVALRPSAGGTTVCERMEAVEEAVGTRAFEGALENGGGFSSRVEGEKGLALGW